MARCIHCGGDTGARTFICPNCEGNKLSQRHNDLISRQQLSLAGPGSGGMDSRPQMAEMLRPHVDAVLEGHRRAASELEELRAGVGGLEDTVRAMYQRQIVESEDFDGDIKAYFTYKDRKPKELSMDELMIFSNDEEDDLSSLLVFKNDEPIPAYSLRLGLLGFDMGNLKEKDLRYLMPIPRYKVDKDAVIIFNRDVSGSISQEEMEMSYTLTLLIEIWLEEAYDDIRSVYIAHNGDAWEESEEGYYNLESGGGTAFEPSYDIPLAMIEHRDYNRQPDVEKKILRPDETDIYMVQMTDGENWDPEPSILKLKEVMPYLTRMCYLETNFGWGFQANQNQHPWAGLFGKAAPNNQSNKSKYWQYLEKNFESEMESQKLRMTGISEVEGVWDAMRVFFGKKGGK